MLIDTSTLTIVAVLAVIIGFAFIWNLTEKWRKTESAVNKPMSITLTTAKSPAELLLEARIARTKRRFAYFVVFVLVWVFLRVRYPEAADSLETLVFGILAAVMRGLAQLFQYVANLLV